MQLGAMGIGTVCLNSLLSRALPVEDYALWVLLFSVLAVFYLIADFGLSQTIAKFTAEYNTTQSGEISKLISTVLCNFAINAGVTYLLILCSAPLLARSFDAKMLSALLRIGGLFVVARIGVEVAAGVLRGFHNFRIASIATVAVTVLEICTYGILFYFFSPTLTVLVLIRSVFFCINLLCISVFLVVFLRKQKHRISISSIRISIFRSIVRFSFPIGIAMLSYYLYTKADVVILGLLSVKGEIALYNVADILFQMPLMLVAAYVSVISPQVTSFYYGNRHDKVQALFSSSLTVITIPMLIVASLFMIIPGVFLWILFPDYPEADILLRILAPLLICKGVGGVASGAFLVSTGHPEILARVTAVGALLNIVFDVLLIPRYGAAGAIVTTTIIHALSIIFSVWYVCRTLTLRFSFGKIPLHRT